MDFVIKGYYVYICLCVLMQLYASDDACTSVYMYAVMHSHVHTHMHVYKHHYNLIN